ncbi:MAG: hypothetical protein FJZ95_10505, partial [Chloroflexi bacterium]|nr:hypothetical protein [Chloroflexota bacterium]
MGILPQNPYLPEIIAEIRASQTYRRFIDLLRTFGIPRIYDCHAHISSGREDTVGDAPPELMPQHPFTIGDVNTLYEGLFRGEGIESTTVVFDTPLPAYNLPKKNEQLLSDIRAMEPPKGVIPFAVVTPEMSVSQIEGWVRGGAKGFKMTPRTSSPFVKRGVISDVSLAEMLNTEALRIANAHRLPLVVHLPQLVVAPRIKPSLKGELVQTALKYPDLKIILAHLGQAQTPAKIEDLLGWMEKNDLWEHVWMDISAVTVPSVMATAMASKARLVFGTDIDFALTERGRYISFKIANGQRTLAGDNDNGNIITALV